MIIFSQAGNLLDIVICLIDLILQFSAILRVVAFFQLDLQICFVILQTAHRRLHAVQDLVALFNGNNQSPIADRGVALFRELIQVAHALTSGSITITASFCLFGAGF